MESAGVNLTSADHKLITDISSGFIWSSIQKKKTGWEGRQAGFNGITNQPINQSIKCYWYSPSSEIQFVSEDFRFSTDPTPLNQMMTQLLKVEATSGLNKWRKLQIKCKYCLQWICLFFSDNWQVRPKWKLEVTDYRFWNSLCSQTSPATECDLGFKISKMSWKNWTNSRRT